GGRVRERGQPLEHERVLGELLVRGQSAEAKRGAVVLDASKLRDAVDRNDALRQRGLALARADDEVGPAGHGARASGERGERVLDGLGGGVRLRHCGAAQTRSGVIGSSRTRAPTALAIAFPIAPAVGTLGGSPTPFEPRGPPFSAGFSIQSTSIRGTSEAVASL